MLQTHFDPYSLPPDAVQDPPTGFWRSIRHIGPGLILAGAIVGTGELIATTNLGARVGFTFLWLVIVSCLIKVFVQVELGRYAISSGQTSLLSFSRLPGPGLVLVWWYIVMVLASQFQIGAMIGSIGQAIHMAAPQLAERTAQLAPGAIGEYISKRPEIPWAIATTISVIVLLCGGSYRLVELGTMLMVVVFTLVSIACVVLLPLADHPIDWAVVAGGLSFQFPTDQAAMLAAFAMFGITGVGASELVAYPYWCIEKGYARRTGARDESTSWATRARGWIRVMLIDSWVSMAIYTVSTIAFYFLGAAVLHGRVAQGLPGNVKEMLDTLAKMYEPVMGHTGSLVFIVIGAFAVLYSTLFAATAANARLFTDALWVSRLTTIDSHTTRRRWISFFCIVWPVGDLLLYLFVGNPVKMVIIGGFVQALTLPMIAAAAVFFRYRRTDRRLTSGPVWDIFLWLSLLALTVVAAYGLFDVYKKATL
jgi:Mn2+/Fe2+ NRAMP family transporter